MRTFFVSTSVGETASIVKDDITGKSISGTVVDEHFIQSDGHGV